MPPLEHFHPMILHFPIVLILVALAIDLIALWRGIPLDGSGTFAKFSLAAVVLAGVSALVAAFLGDAALDIAREAGTPMQVLETHEELGMITAWMLAGWAVLRGLAFWRAIPISGSRVMAVVAAQVVLSGLILVTAYAGGVLVYQHGVAVQTASN